MADQEQRKHARKDNSPDREAGRKDAGAGNASVGAVDGIGGAGGSSGTGGTRAKVRQGCVDELIAFDEDTPIQLIRALRPDVFVKGGDYTRATLPEAPIVEQLGGVVEILPYLRDRSTTGLIERIRIAPAIDDHPEQDGYVDNHPLSRALGQ